MNHSRLPFGVKFLVGFFTFGAVMCSLTVVLLLFPNTSLDVVWRVNPEAHAAFRTMGSWAILLMLAVGTACGAAAIGLALRRAWGYAIAIAILVINSLGDAAGALARHDYRQLIGLPIAVAMIAYLWRVRALFTQKREPSLTRTANNN